MVKIVWYEYCMKGKLLSLVFIISPQYSPNLPVFLVLSSILENSFIPANHISKERMKSNDRYIAPSLKLNAMVNVLNAMKP